MKKTAFIILFIALLSVPAFAQEEKPYWQKAGELVQSGKYAEALNEIDRLLAERPEDALLLRLKGVCHLQLNELDASVKALQKALKQDPNSIASRYYLAQAYAYRGNVLLAIDLLNEVREKAPGSRYAEQAARVLPDLQNLAVTAQAVSDKQRWNVSLRSGGEFDDNVMARSDNDPDVTHADTWRFVSSAYVEIRPVDQNIERTPLTAGLAYSIYQSLHERTEAFEEIDLTSQTARLFLRRGDRMWGKPYKFEVYGDTTDSRLGNHSFGQDVGVGTSLNLQWAPWVTVSPSYSIKWKDFRNDTILPEQFSRDGHEQSFGVSNRFYTFNNSVVLGASYYYRRADTRGSQFDIDSHDVGGSVNVSLPWQLGLAAGVNYSTEDYVQFVPEPTRADDSLSVSASITRPLWNPNLFVEFSYNYTTADSNVVFSEYSRQTFGVTFSYYA
ncbi:MAG: surface lipoprotein assembly modifier [Candidatus Omnitrophota bacterium]